MRPPSTRAVGGMGVGKLRLMAPHPVGGGRAWRACLHGQRPRERERKAGAMAYGVDESTECTAVPTGRLSDVYRVL